MIFPCGGIKTKLVEQLDERFKLKNLQINLPMVLAAIYEEWGSSIDEFEVYLQGRKDNSSAGGKAI